MTESTGATARVACSSCSATYTPGDWRALPLTATLAAEAIQTHLTVPVLWQVEQRLCRCGRLLSGLVRPGAGGAVAA